MRGGLDAEEPLDVREDGDTHQGLGPVLEAEVDPITAGLIHPVEQQGNASTAAAIDTTEVNLDPDGRGTRLGLHRLQQARTLPPKGRNRTQREWSFECQSARANLSEP